MKKMTQSVMWMLACVLLLAGCGKDKPDETKTNQAAAKMEKALEAKGEAKGDEKPAAKAEKQADDKAAPSDKAKAAAKAAATPPPGVIAALRGYEKIRKGLAADDLAAAQAAGKELAASKEDAAADLAGPAGKIGEAKDLKTARAEFGALSKAAIGLVVKTPGAEKGAKVYRCPMQPGYKKWLQLGTEMANPYMGKKMLKCGGEVGMEP